MAKQVGIFKFEGKLGNIVSYNLNGKNVTRTIGIVDKEKMRTAPQYAETRKNQSAFAVASKAGKLFRQALIGITKGYTDHNYPAEVVRTMHQTLRADISQPKGQQTINQGLKNPEAQLAFQKLNIYSKRACQHFQSKLIQSTDSPKEWLLDHNVLWHKTSEANQKAVSLGYLHIDFDGEIAHFEPVLSVHLTRNKEQEYTTLSLPQANKPSTPWTLLIVQVSHPTQNQNGATLQYISILDVIDNEAKCVAVALQIAPASHKSNHIINLLNNTSKSQVSLALLTKYGRYTLHKKKRLSTPLSPSSA